MIVLLLAIALSVLAPLVSAEYWVRPVGQTYGTRDGHSYANAFSGMGPLRHRRLDDQTLWVCGTHRASLVVDESNLTVRLDCPDDPGTILGSELLSADDWPRAAVDGRFSIKLKVRPKVVVIDGQVHPERPLQDLAPGYFAVTPNPRGSTFYLHFAEDLRTREIEVGHRAFGIQIAANERSKVRGLTVLGGGVGWIKNVGAGAAEYPQGKGIAALYDGWPQANFGGAWLIDGVNFSAIQTQAIHAHGTSVPDQVTVRNCRVLEIGGEGIYIKSVPGVVLIENNEIGAQSAIHFGWAGNATAFAGDGIDLGGSDKDTVREVIVRGNRVTNVRGTGIIVHGAKAIVEDNIVEDAYLPGAEEEKGCFRLDPVYDESEIWFTRNRCKNKLGHGIIVRGKLGGRSVVNIGANTVELGAEADGYAAALHPSMNVRGVRYRHNTFTGGQYGLGMTNPASDIGDVEFVSNIVVGAVTPIWIARANLAGRLAIQRNVLHAKSGTGPSVLVLSKRHIVQGGDFIVDHLDFSTNDFDDPKLVGLRPTRELKPRPAELGVWPQTDVDDRAFAALRQPGARQ